MFKKFHVGNVWTIFLVIVSNYWKIAKKSKKNKEQELSQSDKISTKTSAISGKK